MINRFNNYCIKLEKINRKYKIKKKKGIRLKKVIFFYFKTHISN